MLMMDENAQQQALQAFVSLAKHGELAKAAQQLKCSEQDIQNQLRSLQQRLGCQLFIPASQFYQLSPDGLALIEQAELILARYQELAQHCRYLQLGKSLSVSISHQLGFPSPWLTLLACQLQSFEPLLELHFSHSQKHSIHFSFSARPHHQDYQVYPWRKATLIKVAHPRLANHRHPFDDYLKLFDIRENQQNKLFVGETLLLDALEAGLGWAILPEICVESRLAEGQLKAWPEPFGELASYLHLSAHCPEDIGAWLRQQAGNDE